MVSSNQDKNRIINVAIIGGGISGIASAVRLKEALGKNVKITIYERASSPGGVWRDSKWPGAGVDVSIHLYQLYSELNPWWSSKFAGRDEVLAYWNGIIDKHNLRDSFVFDANFTGSVWSTKTQTHSLTFSLSSPSTSTSYNKEEIITTSYLTTEAHVIISAAGALNKPIFPNLEGMNSFKGESWHSSRWRTDVDLTNKKIGLIGNGSSGIQVVPHIVNIPGIEITQFIRSPSFYTPKTNHTYSGLQKFLFAFVPGLNRIYRWNLFYQLDSASLAKGTGPWSNKLRELHTVRLTKYLKEKAPVEYHDILLPKYPLHCKRLAYNAGWLESLNLPNVTLTASPILSVTPTGLTTADGTSHEFDILIWATGFDVSRTGVGLNEEVYGEKEGISLKEIWEEKQGAEAYLAVSVEGFPNYFIVLGPNAISQSWGNTLNNQTEFISRLVKGLITHNLTSISPSSIASKDYNTKLQSRLNQTVLVSTACNAWYRYKNVGKVIAPSGFSGTELYLRTRKIKWADWKCERLVNGNFIEEVTIEESWRLNPFSIAYDWGCNWLENYLRELTT